MNALPPWFYVPAGHLHPNLENRPEKSGQQALEGMAETIRQLGILVPLFVKPYPGRRDHFEIIDGHCRYYSGLLAEVDRFPCTLRRMAPVERMTGSVLTEIVLNTQRTPWSPVEFAMKLGKLRDCGYSQADIARFTGLTQGTISHHLRLLDLDDRTLQRVANKEIPVGAAHEAVIAARAAGPATGPGPREVKPRRPSGGGTPPRRKPRPHFDATHELAGLARELCTGRGHSRWERLRKVACEPCWEDVIRRNEAAKHVPEVLGVPEPDGGAAAVPMPSFQKASGL